MCLEAIAQHGAQATKKGFLRPILPWQDAYSGRGFDDGYEACRKESEQVAATLSDAQLRERARQFHVPDHLRLPALPYRR